MTNNSTDSELLALAKEYMDKVHALTSDIVNASNNLGKTQEELNLLKNKYSGLNKVIEFAKLISPIIIFVFIVFFIHLLPCGVNIEFSGAKVSTSECVHSVAND